MVQNQLAVLPSFHLETRHREILAHQHLPPGPATLHLHLSLLVSRYLALPALQLALHPRLSHSILASLMGRRVVVLRLTSR